MASIFGGNVLYYPGCVTKFFQKDVQDAYESLLTKFGIKFVKLKESERCCGLEALEAGYKNDFNDIVAKNEEIFKAKGIGSIITSCPRCYHTFKNSYGIPTEHIISVIQRNIKRLDRKSGTLTYYDPCTLGRKCGIYNEPREILKSVGYDVVDLHECKEKTMCCGAGGGLKRNSPRVADRVAQIVLSQVKTNALVTSDPLCYQHLKENAKGIKVYELSEVLI